MACCRITIILKRQRFIQVVVLHPNTSASFHEGLMAWRFNFQAKTNPPSSRQMKHLNLQLICFGHVGPDAPEDHQLLCDGEQNVSYCSPGQHDATEYVAAPEHLYQAGILASAAKAYRFFIALPTSASFPSAKRFARILPPNPCLDDGMSRPAVGARQLGGYLEFRVNQNNLNSSDVLSSPMRRCKSFGRV